MPEPYRQAIFDSLYRAMREALSVPEGDRAVREKADFQIGSRPARAISHGQLYLLVRHRVVVASGGSGRVEELLAASQFLLRAFTRSDVHDEGDTKLASLVEGQLLDKHRNPTSVLAKKLALTGQQGPRQTALVLGAFIVALEAFPTRQVVPVQSARDQVCALVSDYAEKRVIGVTNPAVEIPEHDPDHVGVKKELRFLPLQSAVRRPVLVATDRKFSRPHR